MHGVEMCLHDSQLIHCIIRGDGEARHGMHAYTHAGEYLLKQNVCVGNRAQCWHVGLMRWCVFTTVNLFTAPKRSYCACTYAGVYILEQVHVMVNSARMVWCVSTTVDFLHSLIGTGCVCVQL
jgi:hypothetical protein